MKKKTFLSRAACLAALACLLLALTACGSKNSSLDYTSDQGSAVEEQQPSTDAGTTTGETSDGAAETSSLEDLLGADYQNYIVETVTEQMDNRMQDMGDVEYYPIRDEAPLTDYVTIDETTSYEVDEDGNVVILFPAGTVADESHGDQTFIIPTIPEG